MKDLGFETELEGTHVAFDQFDDYRKIQGDLGRRTMNALFALG